MRTILTAGSKNAPQTIALLKGNKYVAKDEVAAQYLYRLAIRNRKKHHDHRSFDGGDVLILTTQIRRINL